MHRHAVLLLAAVTALGCSAATDPSPEHEGDELTEAAGTASYFIARRDQRKCAAPACGGWFVARANRDVTRCADGELAPECYAAGLDLSALKLPHAREAELLDAIGPSTDEARVVLRGELGDRDLGAAGAFGELAVSEAFLAPEARPFVGPLFRITTEGAACAPDACAGLREREPNTSVARNLAHVDLGGAPGSAAQQNDALVEAYSAAGLLAIGENEGTAKDRTLHLDNAFLRLSSGQALCGDAMKSAIVAAADGLLWMSESDRPIEYVNFPGLGDGPLTADRLLERLGKPADTAIEERSMGVFSGPGRNDPEMAPEEVALAIRYRALRAVLEDNLTDVHVFYVGKIELDVYVIGRKRCGGVVGIHTIAIET